MNLRLNVDSRAICRCKLCISIQLDYICYNDVSLCCFEYWVRFVYGLRAISLTESLHSLGLFLNTRCQGCEDGVPCYYCKQAHAYFLTICGWYASMHNYMIHIINHHAYLFITMQSNDEFTIWRRPEKKKYLIVRGIENFLMK